MTSPSVLAEGEPPQPEQKLDRSRHPNDPLSLIEGSPDTWSVVQGQAGCYLMSPYRKGSSRLAIGHHPVLGLGLFIIGFGLSAPSMDATEAIAIQTSQGALIRQGRTVPNMLLFVALDPPALEASLRELEQSGVLWILVRKAALAHGGQEVGTAAAEYRRKCDDGVHP